MQIYESPVERNVCPMRKEVEPGREGPAEGKQMLNEGSKIPSSDDRNVLGRHESGVASHLTIPWIHFEMGIELRKATLIYLRRVLIAHETS